MGCSSSSFSFVRAIVWMVYDALLAQWSLSNYISFNILYIYIYIYMYKIYIYIYYMCVTLCIIYIIYVLYVVYYRDLTKSCLSHSFRLSRLWTQHQEVMPKSCLSVFPHCERKRQNNPFQIRTFHFHPFFSVFKSTASQIKKRTIKI